MSEWNTETMPDFREHGFQTGKLVDFRLNGGTELTGSYIGWGVFMHEGVDYDPVEAWRPHVAHPLNSGPEKQT
jgi:hypothetical protein